jgi:hypothetical protein
MKATAGIAGLRISYGFGYINTGVLERIADILFASSGKQYFISRLRVGCRSGNALALCPVPKPAYRGFPIYYISPSSNAVTVHRLSNDRFLTNTIQFTARVSRSASQEPKPQANTGPRVLLVTDVYKMGSTKTFGYMIYDRGT